jgi:hypothetical protein
MVGGTGKQPAATWEATLTATANLDDIRRAAHRDTQQDGLTEIVTGVFLFIVALATGRPPFYWTYLVGILVLGRGLRWLKARYTYPRIGFVELVNDSPREVGRGVLSWILAVVGVMVVALAISGDLTDNLAWRRWSPALAGALFMGGFLYAASRSGLTRQYLQAMASLALGLLLSTRPFTEPYEGVRLWALLMAMLLLACGALVLRRFVRQNPVVGGPRGPAPVAGGPISPADQRAPGDHDAGAHSAGA